MAINTAEASEIIVRRASCYGFEGDVSSLLAECSLSGSEETSLSLLCKLLAHSFKNVPEKTGARRTMASPCQSSDTPFLSRLGILTPNDGDSVNGSKPVNKETVSIYIDRLCAYYGTRAQDDYFTYVNHDYLFEDPRWKNPTKPRIDSDYDGIDDEEYVYNNKLIPSSGIYAWAKETALSSIESKAFLSTYEDQESRSLPDYGGLLSFAEPILDCMTIGELTNALSSSFKEHGYFPLIRDINVSSLGLNIAAEVNCYSISGPNSLYQKGSVKYNETKNLFAGNFKSLYNLSDDQANKLAADLADFKADYIVLKNEYDDKGQDVFFAYPGEYFGVEGDCEHRDPSGFNLYGLLEEGGISDPTFFRWEYKSKIMPILDMWNQDHLDEIKAFIAYELGSRFWYCLPNEQVGGWFKVDDIGTSPEKLYNDSSFESGAYPFIHDDVIKTYRLSPLYKQRNQKAEELLGELKTSLRGIISSKTWLSERSKEYCYDKLDNLSYCLGASVYSPSSYIGDVENQVGVDYLSKEEGGTIFGNVMRYYDAKRDYFSENIGKQFADSFGFMESLFGSDPLMANAFYSPSHNAINITMGFMTAVKPIESMGKEELLSRYGWVIGHEISHGFDPYGIQRDKDGRTGHCPWTNSEISEYQRRADSIADFYSGYEVMPGEATNGAMTVTEDVADITGVKMCLSIAKGVEGFSYPSFFEKGADAFGGIITRYIYLANGYPEDEHPYGRARVNRCYSCFEEFAEAFDLKEGDLMYVSPSERPVLW